MHVHMEVVPARIPLDPAHNRPRLQVAHLEGEAAVTDTEPIYRPVIRVSVPVHNWLLAKQEKLERQLDRRVTFTEIIADLIKTAQTATKP
jgi:hypothetical protein